MDTLQSPQKILEEWRTDDFINKQYLCSELRRRNILSNYYIMEYNVDDYDWHAEQLSVSDREENTIRLKTYLNKNKELVDLVQMQTEIEFDIDLAKKKLLFRLKYYFHRNANTEGLRRKKAIVLETFSYEEFKNLVQYVGYGDFEKDSSFDYLGYFSKIYEFYFKQASTPEQLIFLYTNTPDFVFERMALEDEKVMQHLITLTEYDDTGFFSGWKDGSSALVNVLKAFSTNTYILNRFKEEPELCNRIYYNLDGVSFIDGKAQSNRLIFANILMQYCLFSHNRPKENAPTFRVGEGYQIATNVTELSGKWFGFGESDEKSFFLQQQQKYTYEEEAEYETDDLGITIATKSQSRIKGLNEGKKYYPLEMVYFVDETAKSVNPETGEDIPQPIMIVPAIYVKAMADAAKWEDINYLIRITTDIIAVVLGVVTLATTGNPYLILVAMADLSLAGIDLTVQALRHEIAKLPGGEQFLKDWDLIYGVGGAIIAAPQLIISVYKGIFVLLPKATKNVQQGLRTMAISLFLDLNAGRFERSQLKFFDTTEWVFPTKGAWNGYKAQVIVSEGVAFFEVQVLKNDNPVNQYIISYQKEILAQGVMNQDKYFTKVVQEIAKNYYSKASLLRTLTELWESKSYQLIEILDDTKKPIGEFDEIFHNKKIFVEDKSAEGLLKNINPKTGKPWQTFESWANKQVYEKTYNRIKALEVARTTRARLPDGLSPDIAIIRNIRKLEFQILETDIEIQKAVHNEIQRLKKEFTDWEFTAKFGK